MTPTPLILVVDDHDSGRFAKTRVMKTAGFSVLEAATGTEALRLVEEHAPDVVLLDVNLPDISGLEVSRRIRSAAGSRSTTSILQISATAISPDDQVDGLEHGADVYLTEPLNARVLVATVHALVRARQAELALDHALGREQAARAEAEEANRVKGDLIATLSHELRTPLNALLGSVWQLRHVTLDEQARGRALERIERSAMAQAHLINDLLDLSRAARGKLPLTLHVLDVAAVAEESVDAVKAAADQKDVALTVSSPRVLTIADPTRLQQVLVNLLTNAIQFTPAGGRITLTAGVVRDRVEIRVHDTGAGIDAEFLPFVFEQFRQGEGGLSRKHGGLGLGLAVVRQLVELHGGTVEVRSDGRDRGTSFLVDLPCEHAAPIAVPRLALAGRSGVTVSEGLDPELVATLDAATGAAMTVVGSLEEGLERAAQDRVELLVVADGVAPSEGLTGASASAVVRVGVDEPAIDVVRRIYRLPGGPINADVRPDTSGQMGT
jgi:signal transduction histidine kinase